MVSARRLSHVVCALTTVTHCALTVLALPVLGERSPSMHQLLFVYLAAGQCNDGLFRLAAEGRLDVLVGQVDRLEAKDVGEAREGGLPWTPACQTYSVAMPRLTCAAFLDCSGEDH